MHHLSSDWLTLDSLSAILADGQLSYSDASKQKIQNSRRIVEDIVRSGKTVYGINTGFGKFSETRISDDEIEELQRRIVLSHACGVGEAIPLDIVKLMMFLKIQSFTYGHSGCSPKVAELLVQMFNHNIIPFVPSKGSVGASGDLAPLAHMALSMIGESDCFFNGEIMSSREALKRANLEAIHLGAKDGLAILNGTQCMGAYLSHALLKLSKLLTLADLISALSLEALTGTSRAFDERIHKVRHQSGQLLVAENIRKLIRGSELIDSRNQVQDAYSLRCIAQVHGASRDSFNHVKTIMERELNAVSDNPLVFIEEKDVLSGGNFHGEPLAMASDFMSIATAELANISERRIAHLIDPHISHLPAFLVESGGLNSGYMIPQYTAAALVSENKVLAHPASVDSLPTSANKEDHVSMGTHASRKLNEIVENTTNVLAIELLCAVQAIELHKKKASPILQSVVDFVRNDIPHWSEDRLMKTDMDQAFELIDKGSLYSHISSKTDLV